MGWRNLLVLLVTFLGVCVAQDKPNIILVIADDVGWGDMGRHDPNILSPNLDRMANDGIFLQNHYVSSLCTPTRTSLLTGRHPHRTGMDYPFFPDSVYGLPLNEVVLGQRMQENGYETHLVGKWHLGFSRFDYLPTRRGFNSHFGNHAQEIDYFNHTTTRIVRGRDEKNPVGFDLFRNGVPVDRQGEYSTTLYGDETVRLIQEQNSSVPFFIYLAFNTIHAPLMAPDSYLNQCNHLPVGNRRTICGMIKSMDDEMGKIEAALKAQGHFDNTLIIFMSDNGGDLFYDSRNFPYSGGKHDSTEGGVKSYSFVYGGYLNSQASRVGYSNGALISVVDWFPTLVKLAGGNPAANPLPLDGIDIWGAITKEEPLPRNEILLAYDRTGFPGGRKALIRDNMKYVINPIGPANFVPDGKPFPRVFLYNLTADPLETTNLASSLPELTAFLAQRVETYGPGILYRTLIFDSVNSDPARFGGYWQPWLTEENHVDSCTQNWAIETPCYFLGTPLIPYLELNRPCPANDYIGAVGPGLTFRNSYGAGPCFWTQQVTQGCTSASCQNGGICSSQGGKPRCACAFGYNGTDCSIEMNFCASNPCQHGGSCQRMVGNYTCDCSGTGFSGRNCQDEINDCPAENPCQNGGKCIDGINSYTCDCSGTGFSGPTCGSNINDCPAKNPCQNGGRCIDGLDSFSCDCSGTGFYGSRCTYKMNCTAAQQVEGNAAWSLTSTPAGGYAWGKCLTGFVGKPYRQCGLDGIFGPIQAPCSSADAECPANAYANAQWTATKVGTVATGSCLPGFTGAPARQCQNDGSWSTLVNNHCVRRNCPALDDDMHASWAEARPETKVVGTCLPGFIGKPTRLCSTLGQWLTISEPCLPYGKCKDETFARATWPATEPGATATGSCIEGWTGAPRRICRPNGTWQTFVREHCQRV